jgi:hypothetical protein
MSATLVSPEAQGFRSTRIHIHPSPLLSFISQQFRFSIMTSECKHEYLEPNEEEIVQCSEDYLLFRVTCISCGMVGFAGGDIAWNPTYWRDEAPESDSQPHNPIPRG